ncbi:hypothetical protein Q5P01_009084 [Channa striata]|uniref:Uncharacterized protein n=1 Tax=Channa striata TaxID=64152 RepID=A0AA88N1Y1_CHASR|nr:hypothetical protein Q5P01_009084 [Channa striata]
MRGLCYFFLLTQVHSSTISVTGRVGQNVTLPCSYDISTQGLLSFCWGRDEVPLSKCSNTILSSEDGDIQFRQSSRYQVLEEKKGNVSLTIVNAQLTDAGVYGCRIEIPGLFNDHKFNTHLVMEAAFFTEKPPTYTPEHLEIGETTLPIIARVLPEEKSKTFLGAGNIARAAAIFFSTVTIILVFIFRRRFWPERPHQHLQTPTAENIYESVPGPDTRNQNQVTAFQTAEVLCVSLLPFLLCQLLGYVSAESVVASAGENVTLPCNYDAQEHGRHPVCWGRGAQFHWDCADKVIQSDKTSVTSRMSERYLLLGDLDQGDVSLSIIGVEERDSGTYSCRVEIPGWFNDLTHEMTLTVMPAPPEPLLIETREVQKRSITVHWTLVFDGGRPVTSYRIYLKPTSGSWDTAVTTRLSNPELTQVTFVDLRPATTYNLRIFAVNSVGVSESSNVLTVTTKEAAPGGPPQDTQLEALSSHSIKVTWKPPRADLINGVLRSYSISYRGCDPVGRVFKKWQHQSVTATQQLESIILTNLRPSTMYKVLIRAKTNAGVGLPPLPLSAPLWMRFIQLQRQKLLSLHPPLPPQRH